MKDMLYVLLFVTTFVVLIVGLSMAAAFLTNLAGV